MRLLGAGGGKKDWEDADSFASFRRRRATRDWGEGGPLYTPAIPAPMTTGAVQYSCPKCGNPLFFTFKVEDAREKLTRKIHCPGCNTLYVADLTISEGAK